MTKEELLKKKVAMISLGCDKNTVDAEKMMYLLKNYGFEFVDDVANANIAIVNTCAFILPSKTESVNKILEVAEYKNQNLEKLIVTGCLTQRYYDEVEKNMPEIDALVRIKNNSKIVEIVCALYGVTETPKLKVKAPNRMLSNAPHYAFLKIADGCNNFCSFCTIPFIRGRYKSVPMEDVIEEAKALVNGGVKELILVAQDVTNYGSDLYGSPQLVKLIQELSKIKKLEWIRLHYCYPHLITDELLDEIESNDKVCKYLDIPLQHISNNILKNMNRKDLAEDIRSLLARIRSLKKPISIRSTFIIGFPGETKKDNDELIDFLKQFKLDNVGFFTYSREENTKAGKMKHQVFEFVKRHRLKKVEQVQQQIMLENQTNRIGKTYKAICDELSAKQEDGSYLYIFRTEENSVSVDTVCYVKTSMPLVVGEFYNIKITGLNGIDLTAELA